MTSPVDTLREPEVDADLEAARETLSDLDLQPFDPGQARGFDGAASALKGLFNPSARMGRTALMVGAPVAVGIDEARNLWAGAMDAADTARAVLTPFPAGPIPETRKQTTSAQDWYFDTVVEGIGSRAVEYWTPDTHAMGGAARTLHTLSNVIGSVPQMIGAAPAFLVNAGADPAIDLTRDGVDSTTATSVGGVNLALTAVGMRMPAAFGNTLATRVATGSGANLALGAGADAASAGVLGQSGYDEQAGRFDWRDAQTRGLDALMGAAFGVNAHLTARMSRADRDSVLTAANAAHFRRETMPGEPASRDAPTRHQDALSRAIEQVIAGEKVNVADLIQADTFVPRAGPRAEPTDAIPATTGVAGQDAAPEASYAAYRRALESGGRADARAATSSATGIDQFTAGTWKRVVAQEKPAWAEGLSEQQLLEARLDPAKSTEMVEALDRESTQALRSQGLPVTRHTLYASHHFGTSKGVAFARASAETLMSEILTTAQLKANPYLKGKTKGEAIANWDARAARAGVPLVPERAIFETPDVAVQRDFVESAVKRGVAYDVARELAPRSLLDGVTGFYEGRVNAVKTDTLQRAILHVSDTGEAAHYVSADVANLSGLNAAMGNRAEHANTHYRQMAQILADELRATGADVIPLRTGGDEMGVVVVNAQAGRVDAAMAQAQVRIRDYADEQGLSEIPHPKRSQERGIGLHMGRADIVAGEIPRTILDRADAGVDLSKTRSTTDVDRSTPRTIGTDAPRGQAGRVASGTAAPSGRVRPAGGDADQAATDVGASVGSNSDLRAGRTSASTIGLPQSPEALLTDALAGSAEIAALGGNTLRIPTGRLDADGRSESIPAAEFLDQAQREFEAAQLDARAVRGAADCLLRASA